MRACGLRPQYPRLAFPEQLNPVVAPGWRPQFFDCLYHGFTNATAFSPTDVMPLARWARAAMTIQATGSLAVLGLVIARAVNILQLTAFGPRVSDSVAGCEHRASVTEPGQPGTLGDETISL